MHGSRTFLRRGAVGLAFLAACVAVLQAGVATVDARRATAHGLRLEPQAPFGMVVASGHDFVVSHNRLIPVGHRSISVPILMYHYIRPAPSIYIDRMGYNLSVTPANFRAQMDWLAINGYHPIDFNDLRAYFADLMPLPDKPVVLTFDDGYSDLYTTAYPILLSYKFKAVAYIVSSFVGQPRYATAEQIVEMDRNGIQIASHTVNHANLANTSLYWATYQLSMSKAWLQRLIGHEVLDFAYPSGKFNAQAVSALQATGYDTAVTEMSGTVHSRADRYTWTRIRVGGGESLSDFIAYLGPEEPAMDMATVIIRPDSDEWAPSLREAGLGARLS